MEENLITAGNDPVKEINVQDVMASGIGPEDFLSHAREGFIATVDDKSTMREKNWKEFRKRGRF